MKNHRLHLTALTLLWFLWDIKEPTPLFQKVGGHRPRWCGLMSTISDDQYLASVAITHLLGAG